MEREAVAKVALTVTKKLFLNKSVEPARRRGEMDKYAFLRLLIFAVWTGFIFGLGVSVGRESR